MVPGLGFFPPSHSKSYKYQSELEDLGRSVLSLQFDRDETAVEIV